ncbi:hypothetical protein GC173_12665, partial [bacterium]|nr:hypothetical protein [bacterium]
MSNVSSSFKVTLPSGETRVVDAGTPVSSFAPPTTAKGLPVIAARYNNKISSLNRPVDRDGQLDYVDQSSRDGGLIYRRSLTFLLIRAIKDLFPDLRVYINHSLNRGYYGEVYNQFVSGEEPSLLAESDIERIKAQMSKLVAENIPFVRRELPVGEAQALFEKHGMTDKVELLKYREGDEISVYSLGDMVNHFYGQLVPSTGFLTALDLKLCGPGFVLLFPQHGRA